MTTVTFRCCIQGPGAETPLKLTIWCDGTAVAEFDPVQQHEFSHSFYDSVDSQKHVIDFVLSNKLPEYTEIDDQGHIQRDCLVYINNKTFADVDVDYVVDTLTVYDHDFNGNGAAVSDTFCGIMGCNGRARFEFTTPIYLWMLEHL